MQRLAQDTERGRRLQSWSLAERIWIEARPAPVFRTKLKPFAQFEVYATRPNHLGSETGSLRLAALARCHGSWLAPGDTDGCPSHVQHWTRGRQKTPAGAARRTQAAQGPAAAVDDRSALVEGRRLCHCQTIKACLQGIQTPGLLVAVSGRDLARMFLATREDYEFNPGSQAMFMETRIPTSSGAAPIYT